MSCSSPNANMIQWPIFVAVVRSADLPTRAILTLSDMCRPSWTIQQSVKWSNRFSCSIDKVPELYHIQPKWFIPVETKHYDGQPMARIHISQLEALRLLQRREYVSLHKAFKMDKKAIAKYIELVSKPLEAKLATQLASRISLPFNGWSEATSHHVAIFSTSPANNSFGQELYPPFSSLGDETSHTAESHYDSLKKILLLFG